MIVKILGIFGVIIVATGLVVYVKDKKQEASKVQFKYN